MSELKIYLEAKDLDEDDREDLLWLEDHPDCFHRLRFLRDDEITLADTSIVGVAVAKSGDGVSKAYFDKNHRYANLMVRLWQELGLSRRPSYSTKKESLK